MRASVGAARRIRRVSGHGVPPRLEFAMDEIGTACGERLGLAEGPYVRVPQPRDEGGEDPGRGERIAERIVAFLDANPEPVRERFEPEVDHPPIQRAGEVRDVEDRRVVPGRSGARRLVTKHGGVEPDVLADDDAALEGFPERVDEVLEPRRSRDAGIGQSVDAGGGGGDGNPGVDAGVDAWRAPNRGPMHLDRADLDDPVVRDVETGRLQIERDRRKGRQRGVARRTVRAGRHASPTFVAMAKESVAATGDR